MNALVEKINEKIDHFQENATNHVNKLNKSAGARARKASLELEKMLKEFRKKSMVFQEKVSKKTQSGRLTQHETRQQRRTVHSFDAPRFIFVAERINSLVCGIPHSRSIPDFTGLTSAIYFATFIGDRVC